MKVPPKRKGNGLCRRVYIVLLAPLNESPSEKEGKFQGAVAYVLLWIALNESPSEKEGKFCAESR